MNFDVNKANAIKKTGKKLVKCKIVLLTVNVKRNTKFVSQHNTIIMYFLLNSKIIRKYVIF